MIPIKSSHLNSHEGQPQSSSCLHDYLLYHCVPLVIVLTRPLLFIPLSILSTMWSLLLLTSAKLSYGNFIVDIESYALNPTDKFIKIAK